MGRQQRGEADQTDTEVQCRGELNQSTMTASSNLIR